MALEELRCHSGELAVEAGVDVEVHLEGVQVYVVIRQLPLPRGAYQLDRTDVLFITDLQYPLSAMDMFWTDVGVVRADGSVPANAESIETYCGRQWRRFSWHRNGLWKPAGNPLLDHIEFMQDRFAQDVAKDVIV